MRSRFGSTSVLYFKSGDQCDLAEKVILLLDSPSLRKEMAQEAYEAYHTVRRSKNGLEYQRIFIDLLNEGRSERDEP